MGIILLFFSISETLLPSGVRILKDRSISESNISIGMEINPLYIPGKSAGYLLKKRGYNYYYLKNIDSLRYLNKFYELLTSDSLFVLEKNERPFSLLNLVLDVYNGQSPPVLSITIGITGFVDESYICELFSEIPDSIIAGTMSYLKIKPIKGKHIFLGEENLIANISPYPHEEEFPPFLVFLQIIANRGHRVKFSPETSPSPFIIYTDIENTTNIFEKPDIEELNAGIEKTIEWLNGEMEDSNRTMLLILTSEMGLNIDGVNDLKERVRDSELYEVKDIWNDYITGGFVCSVNFDVSKILLELFPEAEVIE